MVFCRREPLFFMKVDIPVLHTAYAYDRAGNRTSVQAGDRRESYHYDRGRLTTRTVEHTQDPAGKTYTYRYDAQGNTLGDGENTYLYDCLNRIAEVQTKAGDIQKNHYDAEGLRSQMEENGKLVSFVYADREVITEEYEAGAHIRYIRGHELLASDSERARTYYHYACDEMGSITDITDTNGTVLNHYAYDAFGNRTVEEETVENRFGFAGEMLDAVTGQYYLRARFYNPVIARFLSEDTYYGDGLNLYAYCHNNPVGYVDPSGHICEKKYQELKKKEAGGGTLSAKERQQIYEYEQNQKKSSGAGNGSPSSKGENNSRLYNPNEPMSPSNYPPTDPDYSVPPVRYQPKSIEEVERMRNGRGPTTKASAGDRNIEAHHRKQKSTANGGILDDLEEYTHRRGGNHKRHAEPSELTPKQRAKEIREYWKKRGAEYILPGEGI